MYILIIVEFDAPPCFLGGLRGNLKFILRCALLSLLDLRFLTFCALSLELCFSLTLLIYDETEEELVNDVKLSLAPWLYVTLG